MEDQIGLSLVVTSSSKLSSDIGLSYLTYLVDTHIAYAMIQSFALASRLSLLDVKVTPDSMYSSHGLLLVKDNISQNE